MLPILKEITEILFSKGLIKVLFVTETFAMGLNMPAKTVLFTSARKFDGSNNRWITSNEYIQMAGRAGRRGIDDRGVVIVMVNQQLSADIAKNIIKGDAEPLNSQFRLTNDMVLNLYASHLTMNPELMVQKSFLNYQNYCLLPSLHQKVCDAKLKLEKCQVPNLLEIQSYHNLGNQIESLKQAMRVRVLEEKTVVPFLQPGRMLKIKWKEVDFGWGVLVDYIRKPRSTAKPLVIVEVAVRLSLDSLQYIKTNISKIRPLGEGETGIVEVVPFTFDCIVAVSTIRLKIPDSLYSSNARRHLGNAIQETYKRMADIIPELDPIDHMKIGDEDLKRDMAQLTKLEHQQKHHKIKSRPDFDDIYESHQQKLKLEEELKEATENFRKTKNLQLENQFECRKMVLKSLNYLDSHDRLATKGEIARQIKSGDSLLLTELICSLTKNPAFDDLSTECWGALLSCCVSGESGPMPKLNADLEQCHTNFKAFVHKLGKYMADKNVDIHVEKYVDSFGAQFMYIVYSWCSGALTTDIVTNTPIFEGTIVNCIRRLEQLVRELITAINVDQSPSNCKLLERHLEVLSKSLKRQIAFAPSLYL
uniref:Helicase C-terminal domain-containing protein n=1 Tax=Ditylenchus dipsaci TaxID=166011 RepID=A0A915D7I7_9BILA